MGSLRLEIVVVQIENKYISQWGDFSWQAAGHVMGQEVPLEWIELVDRSGPIIRFYFATGQIMGTNGLPCYIWTAVRPT